MARGGGGGGRWVGGVVQVRETLEFAVLLRLEEGTSREKRMERAQNVMEMLGLEGVADVIVGDALNKVMDTDPCK